MLDFLTYVLCLPYCETTMGDQFDAMLEMVAIRGQQFFQLFQVVTECLIILYNVLFVRLSSCRVALPPSSKEPDCL